MLLITIVRGNICSFLAKLFLARWQSLMSSQCYWFEKIYVPYAGEFSMTISSRVPTAFWNWGYISTFFHICAPSMYSSIWCISSFLGVQDKFCVWKNPPQRVNRNAAQHSHLPSAEAFYPQNVLCTCKIEGTLYMLLYIAGTKIRKRSKCTPNFKMQWEPCVRWSTHPLYTGQYSGFIF